MKQLRSVCLSLLLCLSLLIGFSVTANASELPDNLVDGYTIRQDVYLILRELIVDQEIWKNFTPYDGTVTKENYDFEEYTQYELLVQAKAQIKHRTVWNIQMQSEKNYPFQLGKVNRVTLDNFYWCYLLEDPELHYVRGFDPRTEKAYINVKYTDGTEDTIDVLPVTDSDYSLDVSFEFTPEKNVKEFLYVIDSDVALHLTDGQNDDTEIYITSYLGEQKGDNKHEFTFTVQSEEEQLMSGILGWVKNIFNKLSDMVTAVVELPSTLWNAISNGLVNLFVPSDTDLTAMKDRFDQLLHDKFGILYDCKAIFDGLMDSVSAVGTTYDSRGSNVIVIPETTINLPEGASFTFGGQQVKIIPDGFEWLQDMVRMVISIIATFAVLNLGRYKLEKILGAT